MLGTISCSCKKKKTQKDERGKKKASHGQWILTYVSLLVALPVTQPVLEACRMLVTVHQRLTGTGDFSCFLLFPTSCLKHTCCCTCVESSCANGTEG